MALVTANISYIAWRVGRNFGRWHATRDNRLTLCGKRPAELLSVWRGTKPPRVEDCCGTCRERELRELRNR